MYLDTLLPVVVFAAAVLLPFAVAKRWQVRVRRSRLRLGLTVVMLGYLLAGLTWNIDYMSQHDVTWRANRGTVLYNPRYERRSAWPSLLQQILERTDAGDPIALLGPEPGFYFWTDRRNPLRHDMLLPGLASSSQDAQEIVRRLKRDAPRLIAISQSVTCGRGWFWELPVGRQAYNDLAPVWAYVEDQYRLRTLVGGEKWGYAIYEPKERR
jgi:hypothetical protein